MRKFFNAKVYRSDLNILVSIPSYLREININSEQNHICGNQYVKLVFRGRKWGIVVFESPLLNNSTIKRFAIAFDIIQFNCTNNVYDLIEEKYKRDSINEFNKCEKIYKKFFPNEMGFDSIIKLWNKSHGITRQMLVEVVCNAMDIFNIGYNELNDLVELLYREKKLIAERFRKESCVRFKDNEKNIDIIFSAERNCFIRLRKK